MTQRRYLVEIHDLHPGTSGFLDNLLAILPPDAHRTAVILVVPDWNHCNPIDRDPGFARRLRDFPGEKVLHGYSHTRGTNLWNRFACGTEDHAEFSRLTAVEARARVNAGIALFERSFGERPRWFCAPRWQQSAVTGRTLMDAGLAGCMRYRRLERFNGRTTPVPAVCFDEGARAWRQLCGRLKCALQLRSLLRAGTTFRLTLHPRDLEVRATWKQIGRLLATLEYLGYRPATLEEIAP